MERIKARQPRRWAVYTGGARGFSGISLVACVLFSAPMLRRLCLLLLVCSCAAHAAPPTAPSEEQTLVTGDQRLRVRLEAMGHRVADQTHTVVDEASRLVVNAMGFLGVPYRRGGSSAETGFDCSGFVRAMYEQTVGLLLPRRADQQAAATQVIDKKELQPGDLVFFNTMRRKFSHVGIYVGEGKFIHSPRTGSQVRVDDMSVAYWAKRFNGARRVDASAGE
jgi:cell wall-associated NlpC family hydrolase